MGIGTSLFLIALGAILRFAVHVTARGFNIHTIGIILIVVGIFGLVISLLWTTVWSERRRREGVAYDAAPPSRRVP
jgi:heme/copper-type cytochrome/quinol oxidase subunit 2